MSDFPVRYLNDNGLSRLAPLYNAFCNDPFGVINLPDGAVSDQDFRLLVALRFAERDAKDYDDFKRKVLENLITSAD